MHPSRPRSLTVRSAHEFLHQQNSTSAETRYGALLVRLKEAREHLRWSPAAGRPARFLAAHSAQGQAMAARAIALAAAHGVPELRELVVKPYVCLLRPRISRIRQSFVSDTYSIGDVQRLTESVLPCLFTWATSAGG